MDANMFFSEFTLEAVNKDCTNVVWLSCLPDPTISFRVRSIELVGDYLKLGILYNGEVLPVRGLYNYKHPNEKIYGCPDGIAGGRLYIIN